MADTNTNAALMDAEAIGRAVGLKGSTILDLRQRGVIPGHKLNRRLVRFDLADVVAAIKGRAVDGDAREHT